jgi:hypothetical protein
VFSGVGVTGLRRHLNRLEARARQDTDGFDDDEATLMTGVNGDNDDAAMAGLMHAAVIGGDDGEVDEEFDDGALANTPTPINTQQR